MAQRVLEGLRTPFHLDGHDLHVSMSVGISLFPYDGEDPQTLLKNADTAMYHAKETSRSSYHFYSPAMNAKAFEKLALENSLRRALEQREFVLHYQPQVDIRTGRIIGVEALARWRHPDLGLVAPTKFVPLAEDSGVILPLGEWVLRAACTQNRAWQEAGLSPLRVAVNLSARQFQQPDLVDVVVRTLRETGLDPQHLEFEITEGIAMKDPEYTARVLKAIKQIGAQIAIDDFGIGYSSLSSLKNFPLDALKIDRTFIQDLNTDPIDAAIATALIALGHRLNMRVVAEGVETEDQLRTLLALDCDIMQGHLFCRPVPPEDLEQLLARGARLFRRSPEAGGEMQGAAGG
jgi:EAL domain-containing protein (putative c-di-GMP-specific phosphodiesterase class I)